MSYLLDTDWVIDALSDDSVASTRIKRLPGPVAISRLSILELYEGAFGSPNPDAVLLSVRHLVGSYRIIELDEAVSPRFAETRAFLHRRGDLIASFDLLIAATALTYGLTLLTFNRRPFDRIPGLKLHQP